MWPGGGVDAVGIVHPALEGDDELGVVELRPQFLELELVSHQGGIEGGVELEVFEEGPAQPLALVLGHVALAKGLGAQRLVGGPLVAVAHLPISSRRSLPAVRSDPSVRPSSTSR